MWDLIDQTLLTIFKREHSQIAKNIHVNGISKQIYFGRTTGIKNVKKKKKSFMQIIPTS